MNSQVGAYANIYHAEIYLCGYVCVCVSVGGGGGGGGGVLATCELDGEKK